MNKIINDDCLNYMKSIKENSIDTIITDPPYGLRFKNCKWDYNIPSIEQFNEMLRIIKPGGYLFCFGGSRTFHRIAVNIEDAGWYIQDVMLWLYGSGFPKSVDISYMIDKRRNSLGKVKQKMNVGKIMERSKSKKNIELLEPKLQSAKDFYGWGTNLKPAYEPIIIACKHIEGNYDDNAIKWKIAGLHIDGGRIKNENVQFGIKRTENGRYPSNIILDKNSSKILDKENESIKPSRFFYCSKASIKEKGKDNNFPTVKPIDLMEYLCKLSNTPYENIVLDPFCGTGTTGIACINTNRNYILIERDKDTFKIAKDRINKHNKIKEYFKK